MTADLSQVLPGWRGTDPDGGTWVRLHWSTRSSQSSWRYVRADGQAWGTRTQEEAEAAGLVRLIPAVGYHYDERGEDVVPDAEVSDCENRGGQQCMDCSSRAHHDECVKDCPVCCADLTPAVPTPLDPGNPEHLRRFIADYRAILSSWIKAEHRAGHGHGGTGEDFLLLSRLEAEANRLDRERAEAEQDAKAREQAENFASRAIPCWLDLHLKDRVDVVTALVDFRAERARQEAGQ